MYPPGPPGGAAPPQYGQYALSDIQVTDQPMSRVGFAADPYGAQEYPADTATAPLLATGVRIDAPPSPGPRYETPPVRQIRRYKTTKRVQLDGGNLVLDCPVPTKYLEMVPKRDEKEFTHMRYTAATSDPSNFKQDGFTLRPALMGRGTELFIVMTMYNEDEVLFCRTMHGVMKNIAHLCTRSRSRTWGPDGWKKVVVCIVSDGRSKVNHRTLSVLATMGVYQDGIAKFKVNDKPTTAHLYEYTTQVSVDPSDLNIRGAEKDIVPVQILFCLKEENKKKINSHRWFFQAFGPIIQPNVCVLLDVGTKPGNTSIYHLWKAFDINANVAGACGEIRAQTGFKLINPLVATQNFEYKMSNILDKPLESVFGYISVLPGAFSAYRYKALQNDVNGVGPLEKYFLGETQHGGDADIFTANMYLAEDRILCFELVAKKDAAWVLHYVSSAYGETDVPDTVPEFISQRRRWLNGSFFAGVYAMYHFMKIWGSDHSVFRKVALMIENLYMFINTIFAWFAIGNFYLTFYILSDALGSVRPPPFDAGIANLLHQILRYVYLLLLIVQFIMAMGNRPQGAKWSYTFCMIFFAFLMGYMLFCSIYITYVGVTTALAAAPESAGRLFVLLANGTFRDIIISYLTTYAMYFMASFLFLDPWHMFTSFFQYLFMMPSYTNVLNIYAFCNTHDVSWGTKGDTKVVSEADTAKSKKDAAGNDVVEVSVPTEQKDINAAYEDARADLRKVVKEEKKHVDAKTKQDDYYKNFRTRLVLFWIMSNAALVAAVTNTEILLGFGDEAQRTNVYFAFILWSVAALSTFRFLGSCTFLVLKIFTG